VRAVRERSTSPERASIPWPVRALPGVVFVAGAASLAIEICASRLLAPYFGNSTVVWANVIGLILIYLSAGYWLGGRTADRHPTPRALGAVLLLAAAAIAVLPFVAHPFLNLAVSGLNALSVGVVVGSFFATLLLFAVPVSLLGMVSPFALRLSLPDVTRAGRTSGRLSSLATVGAIVGTFGAALLLIPAFGTQRTMLAASLATALAALPLLLRPAAVIAVVVGALLAVPPAAPKPEVGTIAEREDAYQFVQVLRDPDGKIVMRTDEGVADQSVYRSESALTGGEWDMPLVVPPLMATQPRRILVIGNAGGTTARALATEYPGATIDGVEVDPVVSELGRTYMAMGSVPGLRVHDGDGRAYLSATSRQYDLIVVDAYRQTYIPFHLATEDFFALVREHLAPGGAVALNVERVPGDDSLVRTVAGTVANVFPQVWVWPALRFNELVVGLVKPIPQASIGERLASLPRDVESLAPLVADSAHVVASSASPMTDDHAPVEWLTDRAVLAYIAAGGRLDEQLLPTAP
jgi:spermidine synthase